MTNDLKAVRLKDLFTVKSGDFHAINELDPGNIPLISCGDFNNGLVGYFDIPKETRYSHTLTVAYNGSWPITTKFHPYEFGAKDDVAVLIPLEPMKDCMLLYIGALLNGMIWRYSYGRKCFRAKLENIELLLPVTSMNGREVIDDKVPDELFKHACRRIADGTRESAKCLLGHLDVILTKPAMR